MKLVVTGASGFIGSAVARRAVSEGLDVVNIDSMTYAATEGSTESIARSDGYVHERVDIVDTQAVLAVLERHQPDAIMHLAAESHVDRSIDHPADFVVTNVVGTVSMLTAATTYWESMGPDRRQSFRFHHISTDEVFGELGEHGAFDRTSPYEPRSPYSASKAASDHFVRAWHHTYGLPTLVSNCSNNYGPYQLPEKLIPLVVIRAVRGESIPVYGSGNQVRDWLHVDDHARALLTIIARGAVGESYMVGGDAEQRNIDVVRMICELLDELRPASQPYRDQITPVADRPGHDFRYAVDFSDTTMELGWQPSVTFRDGLRQTVEWYLDNEAWWQPLLSDRQVTRRQGSGDKGART